MATKSVVKTVLATTAVTVALCCSAPSESSLLPSMNYNIPNNNQSIGHWIDGVNQPYAIVENNIDYNNLKIMQNFASSLMENSERLDAKFAQIINEDFSKLL